jgi:hypothetical protein
MLEILQFIFSSFWVFIGTMMLITVIGYFATVFFVGALTALRGKFPIKMW